MNRLLVCFVAAGLIAVCTLLQTSGPDDVLALDQRMHDDPNTTWDTSLTIRDELKSLPSGMLQTARLGWRSACASSPLT